MDKKLDAFLAAQAEEMHNEAYQAWVNDRLEDGYPASEITLEVYDDLLVDRAEAADEELAWRNGCY